MVRLYHGTLVSNVSKILESGIEAGGGTGGAGTFGTFFSGTPDGALYWAKMAYQQENDEKLEAYRFDRDHGYEADQLIAVLSVEIPPNETRHLMADEEQFEDVGAEFDPSDWRQSLEVIGDVRFDGPIPPSWVHEVIRPSVIEARPKVIYGQRRPCEVHVRSYRRHPRPVHQAKVAVRRHLRHPPGMCLCHRSKTVNRVRRKIVRRLR